MTIALYLPNLALGGAERVTLTLARAFSAPHDGGRRDASQSGAGFGREVDLVLDRAAGPLLAEVPHAVTLVDLGASSVRRAYRPLRAYLMQRRPRVLLSALPHNSVIAALAARGTGVPVIAVEHQMTSRDIAARPLPERLVLSWLIRRLYPRMAALGAVSPAVAADLADLAGVPLSAIRVLGNPVVDDSFPARMRQPPAHRWFADPAIPVCVTVGRLSAVKDIDTQILAMAELVRLRPLRLLVLGEGEERPRLQALIDRLGLGDWIDMPGAVADPLPAMAAAHAVLLTSRHEGFGNVLIEAMACGARIIAADCPGAPRALLQDGALGRLVPVGDAHALATAILDSYSWQPNLPGLTEMADAFTVPKVAARYLDMIDAIAADREFSGYRTADD